MDRKSPEKLFIPKQSENLQALVSIDGTAAPGPSRCSLEPKTKPENELQNLVPDSLCTRSHEPPMQANQAQGQTTCYLDPNTSIRSKQAEARTPTAEERTHTERRRAARPDHARTQRTVSGQERATRERAVDWQVAELLDEHSKVPRHSRPLAQPI